ncbi:MAG: hypothetical protein J7L98_00970 [Candidatus Verstraetearchaeota archaeon]|nr:hypothetical protein [Candidatus Verstraetearchaeota archaeon]
MKKAAVKKGELVEDFHVAFSGVRLSKPLSRAELEELLSDKGEVAVQLVDARAVASQRHIVSAAEHAAHSFARGENIAAKLSLEFLLYLAADRQLRSAIEKVGIKEESLEVVAITLGRKKGEVVEALKELLAKLPGEENENLLEISEEKEKHLRKLFDIKEEELEAARKVHGEKALEHTILERIALFHIRK